MGFAPFKDIIHHSVIEVFLPRYQLDIVRIAIVSLQLARYPALVRSLSLWEFRVNQRCELGLIEIDTQNIQAGTDNRCFDGVFPNTRQFFWL